MISDRHKAHLQRAACALALLVWGGSCASVRAHERSAALAARAREHMWATYGGRAGAACATPRGAPRATPTLILEAQAVASPAEATLRSERRGIDARSGDRLEAALLPRAPALLACVRDLTAQAKVEVTLPLNRPVLLSAHSGVDAAEVECLAAELGRALVGVDPGVARVVRLQLGRPRDREAEVSAPAAETAGLRGSLSKAVIRDVIADHISEIRYCYESGLTGWPGLSGSVAVKFIIQPDGSVSPAAIASTTINHRPTECCITHAVSSWRFPSPRGGGIVVVTYPFVLQPAK